MSRFDPIEPFGAPVSIVTQAPSRTLVATVIAAKQQLGNHAKRHKVLYYLSHEVSNTRQPDGRINLGYDDNGQVLANSVSPYSTAFWDNIENGVKPLVQALRAKRYLPYSSCEGHCTISRRYVGLAFASQEAREVFAERIESIKLPGVVCRRLDRVANMKHDGNPENKINPKRSDGFQHYRQDDETDGFNVSFHRHYERYWFLELIILDKTPPVRSLNTLWQSIKLQTLKKFWWSKITDRITKEIEKDDFPAYRM